MPKPKPHVKETDSDQPRDVSVCEAHTPLGNLRKQSFKEIWYSENARRMRESIREKQCSCTNEIFLWPSITFQPVQLIRAMAGAKVWRKTVPLPEGERADWRSGKSVEDSNAKLSLPIITASSES